jgi:hypothetical protein
MSTPGFTAPLIHQSRPRLDLAIEVCWLGALALVPIAFSGPDVVAFFLQPKDFILHFFALLILALWGFEWALGGYRPQVDFGCWTGVRRWLGRNPRNWALAAAGGFGGGGDDIRRPLAIARGQPVGP